MDTRPWNWPPFVAALLGASLLFAQVASAETVIMRRRVGNNAEAMTYDPVNDRAVVMDGNDVIGVALRRMNAELHSERSVEVVEDVRREVSNGTSHVDKPA